MQQIKRYGSKEDQALDLWVKLARSFSVFNRRAAEDTQTPFLINSCSSRSRSLDSYDKKIFSGSINISLPLSIKRLRIAHLLHFASRVIVILMLKTATKEARVVCPIKSQHRLVPFTLSISHSFVEGSLVDNKACIKETGHLHCLDPRLRW